MKYKLKPLKWIDQDDESLLAVGVNHDYTIRIIIGQVVVFWTDKISNSSDSKEEKSIEEAKEWVEKTHYPAQITEWFEVVE